MRPCSLVGGMDTFLSEENLTQCSLRDISHFFPPRRPGLEPRSGHVGFVVDEVALGQVFSEYFGLPYVFGFHRLLHNHHHLLSAVGTVGQLVADVESGLSLTPPQETKKGSTYFVRF
jgi:hypothetical protein